MSHEDVLLMVDAIKSVATAVYVVTWTLSIGITLRELRQWKG